MFKLVSLILGFALFAFSTPANAQSVATCGISGTTVNTHDLAHHCALVRLAQTETIRTVFIGDSITMFWPTSSIWTVYERYLGARSFGIGFDQSRQMLWRLQDGELQIHHPETFVIEAGVTDLNNFRTPEETAAGVLALVAYLNEHSPESRVIVVSTLPFIASGHDFTAAAARTNEILKAQIPVLDVTDVFLLDGEPNPALQPDRTHPNNLGYIMWSTRLLPELWRGK